MKINLHFTLKILFILNVLLFVTGCSLTHKYHPKKFGSSVKSMVNSQIYDRSTIKNPPLDVVQGMDSTKAISDLKKIYRKTDVSKQKIKLLSSPAKE